ncbi:iron uptake transporter deferrochelatase/peroxidase subunit [Paenibacillus wulumuqiensis]|uniref:iron uptake transporter deferrochelatase/peroxidase subunit n=1 Tax=Paenibacillus wulumuqiensis TaxID=1567107 RepID=UPI000AAFE0FF|nr:iron uptake transporter deferrochelatase/peroxidase subunit [Paenibacillus wulumuqiensis]
MSKNKNDNNPQQPNTTPDAGQESSSLFRKPVSRRDMLRLAGASGVGLLLGGSGAYGIMAATGATKQPASDKPGSPDNVTTGIPDANRYDFYGQHQAGITTPSQNFMCFASFDLTVSDAAGLKRLLQAWTRASASLMVGELLDGQNENLNLPPADTGEAAGLTPSRLTVTFGAGPSLFDHRFGLAGKKPAGFGDLPPFNGDNLMPEWCGGDLGVQICADDMQVAFHGMRNLIRIARGSAVLRWSQEGFQRSTESDPNKATPRNLMGFKDGTANPSVQDGAMMNEVVWVQPEDGAGWMTGGSYMAVRRIRMRIEVWDRSSLADQENTFGRYRVSGAPLGSQHEFDRGDMEAKDASGKPVIPMNAHMRVARGDGKMQILRRPYSYSSGMDNTTGQLDAGLFFISYQRSLDKQFIPMQQRLAQNDALNEYIQHIGSAVFACFPGVRQGGYIGDTLL